MRDSAPCKCYTGIKSLHGRTGGLVDSTSVFEQGDAGLISRGAPVGVIDMGQTMDHPEDKLLA